METRNIVSGKYTEAEEEWHISIKKYGWIYRIKDKKRAIITFYLTWIFYSYNGFWQKAFDKILLSNISEVLKTDSIL
jgi:hypothetical protein